MTPRVSVVIPSLDGERDGKLDRLERALATQSFVAREVIVIRGVSPHGRALNLGADQARAEILVIFDDDSEVRDVDLLSKLVAALDADPTIGMAGASVRTPPDANRFQRWAAREFPRFNVPVVDRITDSDLVCHGGVAIPRALFVAVGKENEQLVRGLDPDLRRRVRATGRRIVLVPDCVVYHPVPPDIVSFARIFARNGAGSAMAQKLNPDLVVDTEERLESTGEVAGHSLAYRAARFPVRLVWALLRLRLVRLFGYSCYAVGFLVTYARLRANGGSQS